MSTYSKEDAERALWEWLTQGGTVDPGVAGPRLSIAGNVDVIAQGAAGNGTTDDAAAFATADALSGDKFVPPGTYRFASNTTLTGRYHFDVGALIKPDSGKTVTFSGSIEAPPSAIFDRSAGGTVSLTGFAPVARPEWWGALGDWRQVSDGAVDPGVDGTLLTSATAAFTAADVGKGIGLTKIVAGAVDLALTTTIASYVSATQVHLTAAVTGAVRTAVTTQLWTNDQPAVKACLAGIASATNPIIELRGVTYVVGQDGSSAYSLTVPFSGLRIRGVRGKTWLKHPTGLSRAGGTDILQIVSVDDVVIRDVGFDGNWGNDGTVDSQTGINHTTQADPKNAPVRIRDADGTLLQNCKFRQVYGDYVWIGATNATTLALAMSTAPTNTRMLWCDGDMAARDGVVIGSAVDGLYMAHCAFTNVYTQSLDTEPVGDFVFARNIRADHCTFGGWWNAANAARSANNVVTIIGGQGANAGPTNYASGYRLSHCTIYGAVSIASARDVELFACNVICNFSGYSYSPIVVDHYCDDVRIKDCLVYDRTIYSGTVSGGVPAGSNTSNHDAAIAILRYSDSVPLLPQGVQVTGNRIYARNGRMGIGVFGSGGKAGDTGTATGVTATSLTDTAKTWTTNQWVSHDVVMGSAIGRIGANTATALTIVAWTDALGNSVATPAAGAYTLLATSGLVDIDNNLVDCTNDGNGAGGEGIFVFAAQGNMRVRVRSNQVRNPTGPGIDIKPVDSGRAIAFLALLDNHVWDDQSTPTATATVNFRSSSFMTQLFMRGNTAGAGVPAIVTGLGSGTWRTGGGAAGTFEGYGSPEGVVTAPIGAYYQRLDGTTNTATYRKETGTGDTGWIADSAAAAASQVHAIGEKTDSNQTSIVTVLTDVTQMVFAVAANEVWAYEFVVYYDGSTTGDIRYAVTVPASPTRHLLGNVGLQTGTTNVLNSAISMFAGAATGTNLGATGAATKILAIIKGILENGANAGNVQLQFAQANLDVGTATTVFKGSHFVAHRISP